MRSASTQHQRHNFPLLAVPFFGRHQELRDVVQQLTTPSCRLLTLLGVGGAGKTRLALRAGQELLGHFPDGAWLVVLPPSCTTSALLAAIAETLGLRRAPGADPMAVLLAQLAPLSVLLILDNGEHLSGPASVAFLAELLQRAPDLTLLVASRVALQLREEWLYPVGGLPVPPAAQVEDVDQYAALQLFEAGARRVASRFSLAAEQGAVVEICRLVEGLPLAIELAAGWRHLLPCQAIAQEIARSISFLQSDLRDMPERHRSMRAVFDQSWQLLSPDERRTLQQVSVFRGSFGGEAASAVAGAVLPMLSGLNRTSLIQLQPDGRYHLHELVRHYAAEKFAQEPLTDTVTTRDRHCFYYLRFLAERSAAMNGHNQLQATREIAAELENIRWAWAWAVECQHLTALADAANALYLVHQFRGRYQEGAELFSQAVAGLDDATLEAEPAANVLLYELGWLLIRLGQLPQAEALFARCQAVQQRLGLPPGPGHSSDPQLGLGLLASLRGDYSEARQLLEQARRAAEQTGHQGNALVAAYFLAGIHLAQGQYLAAQVQAETAYAAAEAAGNRWFMAYCLIEVGNAARAHGRYGEAQHAYQASYDLRAAFDDPEGMATALTHQGAVALDQGDLAMAAAAFQRSHLLYREIDDHGGLVTALEGLGRVACARGQVATAARQFHEALHLAIRARLIALEHSLMLSIAELLVQVGDRELARDAVRVVQHTGASHAVQQQARRLLADESAARPAVDPEAMLDDATLLARLQAHLAVLGQQQATSRPAGRPAHESSPPLVEALSAREREILRLLVAGHTYQEIAASLMLALGSVKSHAHNIYAKLGVRNRMQAAVRATELDLL